jgi:hypothetical protein
MTFSIEVDPSVATVPESEELADEAVALDDELPDDDPESAEPEFDALPPHPVRRVDTVTNDINIRDKIFFFILFAPFHLNSWLSLVTVIMIWHEGKKITEVRLSLR